MAGRPLLNRLASDIEALGGDAWFFDLVAEGVSVQAIAREHLGGVSRALIYDWLNSDPSGGRRERLARARELAAEAHAEKAGEVLDELVGKKASSADVQLATQRSNFFKWM